MKFKRIITLFIIFTILLALISFVYADDEDEEMIKETLSEIIQASGEITDEPKINSRTAVVIDRESKTIIYGKNENDKKKMASTTKILTALVTIEHGDLKDIVEISAKAANTGGSGLNVKKGDKLTLHDLLYGLMLRSGNDAAVAIAEHVGGSIEGFSELMNNKVKQLGLTNSHFSTPHGLDQEDHYTTAYELALLTDYALKNQKFKEMVGSKTYTITINGYPRTIENTHELLGYLNGVYGVKTGFTNGAGRCLVTSVQRDGFDIICVVLEADTKKNRTQDSVKLIEYTYSNYEMVEIENLIKQNYESWKQISEKNILINKGKQSYPNTYLEQIPYKRIPLKKDTKDSLRVEIENMQYYEGIMERDFNIGNLKLLISNQEIFTLEILNKNEIQTKKVLDYLLEFTVFFNTNKFLQIYN